MLCIIKRLITLALLLCTNNINGQDLMQYDQVSDDVLGKATIGKRVTFTYKNYSVDVFGKVFKIREGKEIIFGDVGTKGTQQVIPHFFRVKDSTYHMLLVVENLSDISLGLGLYIINGFDSRKIGLLEVAANDTLSGTDQKDLHPVSLVNSLRLQTDGDNLYISFATDKIIIHPGSNREELIDANQEKLIYNGKRLKEVKSLK